MINKQTLRLFNAIQVQSKEQLNISDTIKQNCIKKGFILESNIFPAPETIKDIEDVIGLSGEKANTTFHKNWKTIAETDRETLVAQQILHYITTYGFKTADIYSDSTIFIPNETLNIPEITEDLPITFIKGLTKEEILLEIIKLGKSGIALHSNTLDDIMDIVEYNKYNNDFISEIKNRELSTRLKDLYNIIPTEPVEYLRHVISKLTNQSLLIKNQDLIDKIHESNGKYLDELLQKAPEDLASIFYRYRVLFLAMKKISKNKNFFNRLRKQAKKLHKPLPEDFLNNVTSYIKSGYIDLEKLQDSLAKASVFRKIRLLYALHYRKNPANSIIYQIRNGKGWVDAFFPHQWEDDEMLQALYNIVYDAIVKDIKPKVKGKTFYIPEYIKYALPATEKQFIGNIPNGSYVEVSDNIITGIHWCNLEGKTIDLDLATIGLSGKTGWDGDYTSDGESCIFSGDITSAPEPNGATEAFYIANGKTETKLITLNYYNYNSEYPVNFKFFIAKEKANKWGKNYTVNPNNILCSANSKLDKRETVIGAIANNKVIFANVSVGNKISSRDDEKSTRIRKYLEAKLLNPVDFNKILANAGALVIHNKPKDYEGDIIDLSPENLDKNSFIDLLGG